jgi:hypothetical protein
VKTRKTVLLALLLAILALFVSACASDQTETAVPPTEVVQEPTNTAMPEPTATPLPEPTDTPLPEPTNTPLPEPTDEPTPEATESEAEALDLAMLESPEDLDSFRSSTIISWDGTTSDGEESSGSMSIEIEYVREPEAQHITVSGDLAGLDEMGLAEGESLEMYVVEGIMYMNLFGSWMQLPAEETGFDANELAFVATDEMFTTLEDANYEGTTTYNGIEVRHYTFDENSFAVEEVEEEVQFDEASGNIYIAVEGNYLVHMDMTMSGSNFDVPTGEEGEPLQDGTMELVMDLSDINEPITIVVPEEAMESGQPPEDIPVPEDAEELQVIDIMGMITFLSPSTTEEVAGFYATAMPENGWTEESAEEMSGMFLLEYSKDGRTASFIIMTDDDVGKTSVLISVAEE